MKRVICVVMLAVLLSGCIMRDDGYDCKQYTEEEVLAVYDENAALFTQVAQILINDDDFFYEGRRYKDEYHDAFIDSPYDENMELFSQGDREVLQNFFELGPYCIYYDHHERFIEVDFIGPWTEEDSTALQFYYWIDQSDRIGLRDYILYKRHSFDARMWALENGWYFCTF